MKPISRICRHDKDFFKGKIPAETRYRSDPDNDGPLYIRRNFPTAPECDDLIKEMTSTQSGLQAATRGATRPVSTYYLNGTARN